MHVIGNISVMDVAVMVIVVAVIVLTGYLVATMIWIRRTVMQSERLLSQVNHALPEILRELRRTSENARVVSARARESAEDVCVLVHAVGDVGRTINRLHDGVREKSASVLARLMRVASSARAVANNLRDRVHKEGGATNGKS